MIEVFKTNIEDEPTALRLLAHLHSNFEDWHANFDLDDCDRILRVKPITGNVCRKTLITWMEVKGFWAEELPD